MQDCNINQNIRPNNFLYYTYNTHTPRLTSFPLMKVYFFFLQGYHLAKRFGLDYFTKKVCMWTCEASFLNLSSAMTLVLFLGTKPIWFNILDSYLVWRTYSTFMLWWTQIWIWLVFVDQKTGIEAFLKTNSFLN